MSTMIDNMDEMDAYTDFIEDAYERLAAKEERYVKIAQENNLETVTGDYGTIESFEEIGTLTAKTGRKGKHYHLVIHTIPNATECMLKHQPVPEPTTKHFNIYTYAPGHLRRYDKMIQQIKDAQAQNFQLRATVIHGANHYSPTKADKVAVVFIDQYHLPPQPKVEVY